MADLQETLGTVIREERRKRRRTMKWLAEKAGLSLVYLGEIEHGKKYPSALVLERVAWALDLRIDGLLELVIADLRRAEQPIRIEAVARRLPERTEAVVSTMPRDTPASLKMAA